jgi:hypothetical protein
LVVQLEAAMGLALTALASTSRKEHAMLQAQAQQRQQKQLAAADAARAKMAAGGGSAAGGAAGGATVSAASADCSQAASDEEDQGISEEEEEDEEEEEERWEAPPAPLSLSAPPAPLPVAAGQPQQQALSRRERKLRELVRGLRRMDRDSPWDVLVTPEVHSILGSERLPWQERCAAMGTIMSLASGEWSEDQAKVLKGTPAGFTLHEARVNEKIRVLWEVAVDFSPRVDSYSQVVRVWTVVFTHDRYIGTGISRAAQRAQQEKQDLEQLGLCMEKACCAPCARCRRARQGCPGPRCAALQMTQAPARGRGRRTCTSW